jgi:hypothetical protein
MGRNLLIGALVLSTLGLCLPFALTQPHPAQGQRPFPASTPTASHRRIVLPLERSPRFGALLVPVQVNGKPAVLIVDTGSNTTILSPEICGLNAARLPRAEPPPKGTGFVGEGRWGQATLTIGTAIWKDRRVLIVDTTDLTEATQRKIDGILGQDILDDFKYVEINLEAKRITLRSN